MCPNNEGRAVVSGDYDVIGEESDFNPIVLLGIVEQWAIVCPIVLVGVRSE